MAKYKYTTAKETSDLGKHQSSFSCIWDKIPASIKDKLTGAELGTLVDLLWSQKEYGENKMYCDLTGQNFYNQKPANN